MCSDSSPTSNVSVARKCRKPLKHKQDTVLRTSQTLVRKLAYANPAVNMRRRCSQGGQLLSGQLYRPAGWLAFFSIPLLAAGAERTLVKFLLYTFRTERSWKSGRCRACAVIASLRLIHLSGSTICFQGLAKSTISGGRTAKPQNQPRFKKGLNEYRGRRSPT